MIKYSYMCDLQESRVDTVIQIGCKYRPFIHITWHFDYIIISSSTTFKIELKNMKDFFFIIWLFYFSIISLVVPSMIFMVLQVVYTPSLYTSCISLTHSSANQSVDQTKGGSLRSAPRTLRANRLYWNVSQVASWVGNELGWDPLTHHEG